MVKVGINQPYYLPYVGFFERVKACDYFVVNPLTPLNRTRAFHRRTKIIQQHRNAPQRFLYLTQCVSHLAEGKFFSDISLDERFWERQQIHIKTIVSTYKRAKYFRLLDNLLRLMAEQSSDLGSYNTKLIKETSKILGLSNKIIDASKDSKLLAIDFAEGSGEFANKATQITFFICKKLGATLHIAGQNGPLWLDETPFIKAGIGVLYQRIKFKAYPQFHRGDSFVPGLSAIDLIANNGLRSRRILGQNSDLVSREELLRTTKLTGR